jgi:uncharacterized membrane protein YhaH (DUF805 family)
MSSNPYAAPNAAVADTHADHAGVGTLNLWSARGRIGRLRYVAWGTGAYLLFGVVLAMVPLLLGSRARGTGEALIGLLVIPMVVLWTFWAIQRAHDMDRSGWQVLLMLIPVIGIIWTFIWLFGRGTPHANRYGPPPPPNSLGVKILGTVFPALVIIGILAAVALPAYNDYVKRAQAVKTGQAVRR